MMESGCVDMGDERICNFLLSTQHDEEAAIYRNQTKDCHTYISLEQM